MKRVRHYLQYRAIVRGATMVFAAAAMVLSIQACQEEVIKPGDEHREPTKHPPTEDGLVSAAASAGIYREPTKHPAKVTVPEIKVAKVTVSDVKVQ